MLLPLLLFEDITRGDVAVMIEVPCGVEMMSSGVKLVLENCEEDKAVAVMPVAVPVGESCFNISRIKKFVTKNDAKEKQLY